eukprot:Nk52_evm1s1836 gene=Nk52_evmTU1s1836
MWSKFEKLNGEDPKSHLSPSNYDIMMNDEQSSRETIDDSSNNLTLDKQEQVKSDANSRITEKGATKNGRSDDELTLKKGESVLVTYKDEASGWLLGRRMSDGEEGLFPGNYVSAIV